MVEEWAIDQLKPYPRNPRQNETAVAKVAASIQVFGFRQPLVVDAQGVIIAGHTRLLAARQLGLATVPVHVARGLTASQVRAYRLADNRTAQESTWDDGALVEELLALKAEDYDLGLTAFDVDELARLLGDISEVGYSGLPDGEKPNFEQMTFTLHTSQADTVREALDAAKAAGPFVDALNENSNGNALARLAELALASLR